jgi:hypothetical protein
MLLVEEGSILRNAGNLGKIKFESNYREDRPTLLDD